MEYVYVIGGKEPPYKIGRAKNPKARLSELGCASPVALSIWHTVECGPHGGRQVEQKAHQLLAEHRLSGEWFDRLLQECVAAVDTALETLVRPRPKLLSGMEPDDLRAWRAERGLSQRKLAEAIGYHWRTIQEYEKGSMQIPRKFMLALMGLAGDQALGNEHAHSKTD